MLPVVLQEPCLPPEEDDRDRHDHEDLEENPVVDARESHVEASGYSAAIEREDTADLADRFGYANYLAGDAAVDDFRHGAVAKAENRRPARHCFDHHQAERL